MRAVSMGDKAEVKDLLSKGVDANAIPPKVFLC